MYGVFTTLAIILEFIPAAIDGRVFDFKAKPLAYGARLLCVYKQ
jgi:hypothetical protein